MSGRFTSNLIKRKQFGIFKNTYHKLSHDTISHIKNQYQKNTTNKSKEINIEELKSELDKYGIEYENNENFQKIFSDVEKNGSSNFDFDKFINIMAESMGGIDSMNYLQKVYLLFLGEENTDKIEIRHVKKECPWLKDEEIKEMIDKIDGDKDGKINFEEFHNITTKLI
jgi:Ca2+-binding EF-hand superfamily protein